MPNRVEVLPRELITRLLVVAAGLVLIIKLYLASVLDLYSDEIFYWLESTRLALAYSDLPFMTALLVGLGSSLDPGNPLAARALFILLGSLLPFLVWWIALPVCPRQQAREAALLSLCLPLGGFLGLLAVPDVLLIIFGLAALGFFQRALDNNSLVYWLGTGVLVALGLSTHYRFVLYPAAVILFLVAYRPLHSQWRNPRLWLAMTIAATGSFPILWFNLNNELSSVSFYLVQRHPWEFQPAGLLHVFKQAGVVSPPLYVMLWYTAWRMYLQARDGNGAAGLLLSVALLNLLVYLLLAPWTDSSSTSLHWPISGYLPLLVFLPATLRELYEWTQQRLSSQLARNLVLAIPAIGFTGTLVAFAGIGSQAYQTQLQPILGTGVLSNKMAGWKEFATHTNALLQEQLSGLEPIIVTDNYYTAAQLPFAGVTMDAYSIDNDKAVRDGRFVQLQLWQRGEASLAGHAGRPMLFITEDSSLNIPDKIEVLKRACSWSDNLRQLDTLRLFSGDKSFSYYLGAAINPSRRDDNPAFPCPFPPLAWIDAPQEDAVLSDSFEVAGWAYIEDLGVDRVFLLLDGERHAEMAYGVTREDVVRVQGVETDPNRPDLGYRFLLDTLALANGRYMLSIEIVDRDGFSSFFGRRRVVIRN